MVGKKNKNILDAIMHRFSELGYVMSTKVLSAEHYGVPQRRRRTIVVGNRRGYEFKFPEPKFGEKKKSTSICYSRKGIQKDFKER